MRNTHDNEDAVASFFNGKKMSNRVKHGNLKSTVFVSS